MAGAVRRRRLVLGRMAQKTLIGGEDAMAVALDWIGITVALLLLSLLACFLLCVSVCSRADDGGSVCFRL